MVDSDDDVALAQQFMRFVGIVRELRRSCPWDRVQTADSLRRYLLEEAYEAVAAIEMGDRSGLADELGDLLLQIVLHATIAAESGVFDLTRIIRQGADKLIRRHPHVFANAPARDAQEVAQRWEEIKRQERRVAAAPATLDLIPRALPALLRAEKLGARARAAGMDWADLRAVLGKVREELAEVEEALDRGQQAAAALELGDALLALANAPRFVDASAEDVLRQACDKFVGRFTALENEIQASGRTLSDLTPQEIDAAWRRAKGR
ncbi:MAG TPA: nucleoside triphosphate pyrophosphohydrolase [Candidatus Binataceae bacterium]|nr:nucleoside triphosphate pyrophosphohydrolase [Candidatus Binataceae bacterium]